MPHRWATKRPLSGRLWWRGSHLLHTTRPNLSAEELSKAPVRASKRLGAAVQPRALAAPPSSHLRLHCRGLPYPNSKPASLPSPPPHLPGKTGLRKCTVTIRSVHRAQRATHTCRSHIPVDSWGQRGPGPSDQNRAGSGAGFSGHHHHLHPAFASSPEVCVVYPEVDPDYLTTGEAPDRPIQMDASTLLASGCCLNLSPGTLIPATGVGSSRIPC